MDQDNGALNISDDGLQMMKEQMQNVRFHHNDTHCICSMVTYFVSLSSHSASSLCFSVCGWRGDTFVSERFDHLGQYISPLRSSLALLCPA